MPNACNCSDKRTLPARSWGTEALNAKLQLAPRRNLWIVNWMSAQEIIEQIKELSPAERAQVTKFVVETDDSWIPDEFKEAMKDSEAGRLVDMEN